MHDMNATAPDFGPLAPFRALDAKLAERAADVSEATGDPDPALLTSWVRAELRAALDRSERSEDELDTVAASAIARKTPATIRRWCRDGYGNRGILRHSMRGGAYVIDRRDLIDYLGGPVRLEDDHREAA